MTPFPCTGCGACCRRVRLVDPTWPVGSDGKSCVHLTPDSKCAIYATRPAICRVDDRRPSGVSVAEWHRLNATACNRMQEEDGLDAALRVPPPHPEPPEK